MATKTVKIEIPTQANVKIPAINIEVPEGCIAKFDESTQGIKFMPVDDYTIIKDFKTACEVLGVSSDIPAEIKVNNQLCAMYKMQIVLKAVNQGHNFYLTNGEVWYPYVRFIGKSDVDRRICSEESRILDFKYSGKTYTLVGGLTSTGPSDGLGCFSSHYSVGSVGRSDALIGFFACHSKQIAHHVSKYFAALIFDCCFSRELYFSLSNGERVTKIYD